MSTPPSPKDAIDSELRAEWTHAGVTVNALPSASKALGRSAHDAIAQTLARPGPIAHTQHGPEVQLGPEIGRGGQAIIRSAHQTALRRTVAVKIPRQYDDALTSTLLREAWVASSLEHPNIVPIHALSADAQGRPLLIMKRIEGVEWSEALEDPTKIPGDALGDVFEWHLQTLIRLCDAVEFAHSRHVLHLDIKPSNVMLGAHGEVYLLDWGLAVAFVDDAPAWLPRGSDIRHLLGTPAFMSPEQACGDGRALGPATDIYLLGALLYTIVNGRRLREGSPINAINQAWKGVITPFNAQVPAELEQLCRRALAQDPADRFASVSDFRRALEAFLRHRGARALADRALARMPAVLVDPFADPRAMHEVRFGLQQALADWPGHSAAADALQSVLVRICDAHIERGEADAAAALLPELVHTDPALIERLDALRVRQTREAEEVASLRRDRDLSVNHRQRNLWILGLGLFWCVSNLVTGYLHRSGIMPVDYWLLVGLSLGTLICFRLGVWRVRGSMRKIDIDRRMIDAIGAGLVSALSLWFVAARLGLTTPEAMASSTVLYLFFVMAQAAHLDRRLGWVGIALAPVIIAAGLWPAYGFEWAGVAGLVCGWVPWMIWRRDGG